MLTFYCLEEDEMGQAYDDFCEVERLTSRVKTLHDSRQRWKKRALKAEAEIKKFTEQNPRYKGQLPPGA